MSKPYDRATGWKNPFADRVMAAGYENWYLTVGGRADHQEKFLLKWLLSRFSMARSIVEIGCGTGHFTRWFGECGLKAVGLELSRAMLDEAVSLRGSDCLQGDAGALPFASLSFDLAALITTLAFLPDPQRALAEALRIFKEHRLDVHPGPMSTLIAGDNEAVFAAVRAAFQQSAGQGRVVMVVTYSNACL